jgi:hypothetical protein
MDPSKISLVTEFVESVAGFPSDILFVAFLFLIFFIYTLYNGKAWLVYLILSLYPSALLAYHFPQKYLSAVEKLSRSNDGLTRLVIFFFLIFTTAFVLKRVVSVTTSRNGKIRLTVEAAILSMFSVGLFVSLLLYLLTPPGPPYATSAMFNFLFFSPYASFLWLITPLAALLAIFRIQKKAN